MTITTKCRECGKTYRVKDELTGKKIRCKACQGVITVVPVKTRTANSPAPRPKSRSKPKAQPEDDWLSDDFDDDDYGDSELPPPRPKKKSKKKKKKSGNGAGLAILKYIGIGAGVLVGLIVMLGVIGAIAKSGAFSGLGVSWQTYTTPDGKVTCLLPGKSKNVPNIHIVAGGTSIGAETRKFACFVKTEPLPGDLANLDQGELLSAMKTGLRGMGATGIKDATILGHPGMEFTQKINGITSESKGILVGNTAYTFSFANRGGSGIDSARKKFFDSIQLK